MYSLIQLESWAKDGDSPVSEMHILPISFISQVQRGHREASLESGVTTRQD